MDASNEQFSSSFFCRFFSCVVGSLWPWRGSSAGWKDRRRVDTQMIGGNCPVVVLTGSGAQALAVMIVSGSFVIMNSWLDRLPQHAGGAMLQPGAKGRDPFGAGPGGSPGAGFGANEFAGMGGTMAGPALGAAGGMRAGAGAGAGAGAMGVMGLRASSGWGKHVALSRGMEGLAGIGAHLRTRPAALPARPSRHRVIRSGAVASRERQPRLRRA